MQSSDPTRTAPPVEHPTGSVADPAATTGDAPSQSVILAPCTARDRYALGEEIARGGMGEVYRATDTVLGREVAVKVLQTKFSPTSLTACRFFDEARITAQLQHPGIPPVHDLGTLPDGRPFLAMKLIKGQTLEDQLKARPNPSADRGRFVAAFEAVCQAVAYAHAHGVIHRDLKPQNVMVGSFGEVQVMDWGLAKVLATAERRASVDPESTAPGTVVQSLRDSDDLLTQAGSVLGTPAYMAPEQAVGAAGKVDARSDVFGLGGLLAAVLTGQPPFAGGSAETTRVKAAQGKVQECFVRLDASRADPELVALCKRCLAPEREDRLADAGAVAQAVAALRQAADDRARQAELDRVLAESQAAEQRKRRRAAVVAGGLLAGVLAVGVAGTTWGMLGMREQRNAADIARLEAEANAQTARAAQSEAVRNARVAEEQADLAVETLQGLANDVNFELMSEPGTQALRTRLLERALAGLGRIVESAERSDALDNIRSAVYFNRGDILQKLGKGREAMEQFRRSEEIDRRRVEANGRSNPSRFALGSLLFRLAELSTGVERDPARAIGYFDQCRRLMRENLDDPRPPALGERLPRDGRRSPLMLEARSLQRIGLIHVALGEPAPALDHLRRALGAWEAAWAEFPKSLTIRQELPLFRCSLAGGLFDAGELASARAESDRAAAEARAELKATPDDYVMARITAVITAYHGRMLLRLGKAEAAGPVLEESCARFETMRQRDRNDSVADDFHVFARYQLGRYWLTRGDRAQAEKEFLAALALTDRLLTLDPENVERQLNHLQALAQARDGSEAAELAGKLRTAWPADREVLLAVAQGYAVLTGREMDPKKAAELRAKAVEAVEQAVAKGYRNAVHLEKELDLEAIRSEPRFKSAVAAIRAPAMPPRKR